MDLANLVERNLDQWAKDILAQSQAHRNKQVQFKLDSRAARIGIDFYSSESGVDALLKGEQVEVIDEIKRQRRSDSNKADPYLLCWSENLVLNAEKLAKSNNEVRLDSGLETVYLTVGLLNWTTSDEATTYVSPLVVVPCLLSIQGAGTNKRVYLQMRDGDGPSSNLALAMMLNREFDLTLDDASKIKNFSLFKLFFEKTAKKVQQFNWKVSTFEEFSNVSPDSAIVNLSFQLEAIYQDIQANKELLASSPLIQALIDTDGLSEGINRDEDFVASDAIDTVRPPEDAFDIFPSDSSQRVCIDAALRGLTFTIDGPPGTGKTQTITNILANLIMQGKSVLFVAQKDTALTAVYDNLSKRGLSKSVLRFKEGKNTRADFARQLEEILNSAKSQNLSRGMTAREIADLKRARQNLSINALELAQVHPGLGESIADLIGRATRTHSVPLPEISLSSEILDFILSPENFSEILSVTKSLIQVWDVVDNKAASKWFEVDSQLKWQQVETFQNTYKSVTHVLDGAIKDFESLTPTQLLGINALLESRILGSLPSRLPECGISDLSRDLVTLREVSALWIKVRSEIAEHGYSMSQFQTLAATSQRKEFRDLQDAISRLGRDEINVSSINERITEIERQLDCVRSIVNFDYESIPSLGNATLETWAGAITLRDLIRSSSKSIRPSVKWFYPRRAKASDLEDIITALTPHIQTIREFETLLISTYGSKQNAPDFDRLQVLSVPQNWLQKRLAATREALAQINQNSRSDISLDQAFEYMSKHRAHRNAFNAIRSMLSTNPLLKSFKIEKLEEFDDLIEALNSTVWALSHESNPYGPLVNATVDSDVFIENKAITSGKVFQKFASTVDILEGIAKRTSDLQLKRLLGESSLRQTEGALAESLEKLVLFRDSMSVLGVEIPATGFDDISRWVSFVEDLDMDVRLLQQAMAKLEDSPVATWDFEHVASLGNFYSQDPRIIDGVGFLQFRDLQRLSILAGDETNVVSLFTESVSTLNSSLNSTSYHLPLGELKMFAIKLLEDREGHAKRDDFSELLDRPVAKKIGCILEQAVVTEVPRQELVDFVHSSLAKMIIEEKIRSANIFSTGFVNELRSMAEDFNKLDDKFVEIEATRRVAEVLGQRALGISKQAKDRVTANAAKKRGHPSIEDQISSLGSDILNLAPIVMASPLGVSRYMPTDLRFDYVIFDEASQMFPAFALSSLYRANAAIIAGDEKQMPPTYQIGAIGGSDTDETYSEDDPALLEARDYESLLGLAKRGPAFLKAKLLWHYRSRNEGLIAYSNQAFYNGELVTFPSPGESDENRSVKFHYVENGVWIPGTGRSGHLGGPQSTNPIEAKAVAEAVRAHAKGFRDPTNPAFNKSLMVVAMGKYQALEIEQQVERLAESDKNLRDFISIDDPKNSFVVRNLETVQGDERDFVFLSFQYNSRVASDPNRINPTFGPLSKDKGWRRLNVAITRARYEMHVFASFRAGNFGDTLSESISHVRNFINYAEVGPTALKSTGTLKSKGFVESPFEYEVLQFVSGLGYECVTQVGSAGYRIDIGVKHKAYPGVFMVAIECDGAMYHSSKVARDRDKLRQSVLEGLGWSFYRIWGTRWYRYTETEKKQLAQFLENQSKLAPRGIFVETPPAFEDRSTEKIADVVEIASKSSDTGGVVPKRLPSRKEILETEIAKIEEPSRLVVRDSNVGNAEFVLGIANEEVSDFGGSSTFAEPNPSGANSPEGLIDDNSIAGLEEDDWRFD